MSDNTSIQQGMEDNCARGPEVPRTVAEERKVEANWFLGKVVMVGIWCRHRQCKPFVQEVWRLQAECMLRKGGADFRLATL